MAIITTTIIYANISSKVEQQMTFARYQTCYTNSTEGPKIEVSAVFLHDAKNLKYWLVVRHFACYRSTTNHKPTFFQKVLVFSDGKQSLEPCLIVMFGVLLFRLDTNSSNAHDWQ